MPTVREIADHLAPHLDRARYHRDGDPAGVWIDSEKPVRRLGLRLDAGRPPYRWADGLDAVLVHRPFGLWPARLPDGLGVLAAHRALDDGLSVGNNPALAEALGLTPDGEPLLYKERTIGLVGRWPQPLAGTEAETRIAAELGGTAAELGSTPEAVGAVALMGAMTEALVLEAAARGTGLYVTGQLRQPAREAVKRTGIRVLAVGQDRAEAWGLRHLGRLVREHWPEVEIAEAGLPG